MVEVSVIIPSRNEQETIGDCIKKIRKALEDIELNAEIIVADNSEDNTPEIARSLGADVITPDGRGYGYAYKYAFKYLKAKHGSYPKYVVIGDADGTYDFSEIPKLLEPLMKGEADLVIGSRFKGKIEKGAMPWYRRWIGNPILTMFLNLFYKVGVSDAHSGFRAIRGEALNKIEIHSNGMEFASEMLIEAARKGLRIAEVPITYRRRVYGKSKLSSLQDGWRHLKFMLTYAPKHLYMYPGAFFMVVGAILLLSALFRVNLGYSPGVHTSIAGSLLLIVGFQMLLFGVFTKMLLGERLPKFLSLERSLTIGSLIFMAGFVGAAKIGLDWIMSGFEYLPPAVYSVTCLTLMVLGLQAFLSSFLMSVIAEKKHKWTP
ncbi:MAG: glycosyltransferase family 2 protein [Nitrososphaerota archaeon]|nr:glycosyltransferase family 2 protein [Nitrososphaerota archaeon]